MTATRWTSTRECSGQQALRSRALVLHGLLRRNPLHLPQHGAVGLVRRMLLLPAVGTGVSTCMVAHPLLETNCCWRDHAPCRPCEPSCHACTPAPLPLAAAAP